MTVELTPLGVACQLSCTYCADPDTPVLLRTGASAPLGSLREGDTLWSFEEQRRQPGAHRALLQGQVARVWHTRRRAVRIVHEYGELVLGEDHHILDRRSRWIHAKELTVGRALRFLPTPDTPVETDAYRLGYVAGIWEGDGTAGSYKRSGLVGGKYPYRTPQYSYRLAMNDTEALDRTEVFARGLNVPLRRITFNAGAGYKMPALFGGSKEVAEKMSEVLQPRESDREWLRGWIAGMFDAEGTKFENGPPRICQANDARRRRAARALRDFGFDTAEEAASVRVRGGFAEALRFAALFQPALLRKTDLTGAAPKYVTSRVLAVESIGKKDLADISVDGAPTYFAAGVPSHNCYQHPMRDAGNIGNRAGYDFDKMFAALEKEGGQFTVFGGEPLLVPLADLRRIWQWGYERYKQNGIQTNGVLITPAHIEAFKEYKVHVGFSLDGPGELNDSRWAGTLEKTRESTAKSHANLKACIEAGVGTSLIITLYKGNALPEKLPQLKEWIRELDRIGIRGVRIHLLEVDHALVRERMQLSQEQTVDALLDLIELERTLPSVRLDILTDMRRLLRAEDESVTCTWNPCDPYTTSAVRGVDGQGNQSNCGRTNKDGIPRVKAEQPGFERQLALYRTPYESGGCQGCRFFLACKGQCPGTAIDGDWRNRTADCQIWMRLFNVLEQEMVDAGEVPLSMSGDRAQVEQAMLQIWAQGTHVPIKRIRDRMHRGLPIFGSGQVSNGHGDSPHGDSHGDHTDAGRGLPAPPPPSHGDAPHGDGHGDHTDATRTRA